VQATLDPAVSTPPVPVTAERTAPTMVAVEALTVRYRGKTAVDAVSLDVAAGEILSLVGPSGSGKSTLLRTIAGIERPASGRILLEGREVAGPGVFVEPEARHVGMVFQDYALFPHLTVAANVAFGLGRRARGRAAAVGALLDRVGLADRAAAYPHMLSGGERQRVALARALAPAPRVLLMDEPFSSLDARLRARVRHETLALLRDLGTTVIIVTHDPAEAVELGDRVALLRDGRLVQAGPPREVYARPATTFAARFFSDINELIGTCRGGIIETPAGQFAAPGLPDGAPARVCLRPQDIKTCAIGLPARVVSSTFLGDGERVVTELQCGARLTVQAPGHPGLAPGDTVHLDIDRDHAVVLADAD